VYPTARNHRKAVTLDYVVGGDERDRPWFAIGGINLQTSTWCWRQARAVCVVSAILKPRRDEACREFRERLG